MGEAIQKLGGAYSISRIFPPNWCLLDTRECVDCNYVECEEKILKILKSVEYQTIDFTDRPKLISATTIAIYFGYCERLAHFFLRYPQIEQLSIVESNFVCTKEYYLPAKADIPRILLDLLTHGVDSAPTDDVHRLRLMIGMKKSKTNRAKLVTGDTEKQVIVDQAEIEAFHEKGLAWKEAILNGTHLTFKMTPDLNKCKYCFLKNCDKELE